MPTISTVSSAGYATVLLDKLPTKQLVPNRTVATDAKSVSNTDQLPFRQTGDVQGRPAVT